MYNLVNLVKESYNLYIECCNNLKDLLNKNINTNLIKDILYQPSDGLVMLVEYNSNELNVLLDLDRLSKIHNEIEFIKYVKNNSI